MERSWGALWFGDEDSSSFVVADESEGEIKFVVHTQPQKESFTSDERNVNCIMEIFHFSHYFLVYMLSR